MNQLDYAATCAQVSIEQVLALIDYRPSRAADEQWRGPCPLCPTPSRPHLRCFSVNLGTNLMRPELAETQSVGVCLDSVRRLPAAWAAQPRL